MYKTITTNIMVKNVKETIQFYEEKLGFQTTVSVPGTKETLDFAIVQKDDISIMFQEQKSLESEYPTLTTETIKPMFTLFIKVENAKQVYDELASKVKIAAELHKTNYSNEEFAIFDNNGNILTIAS